METLRENPGPLPASPSRPFPGPDARFRPFRRGSYIVRLAGSLPDLEACLALERGSPSHWRGRLAEPTAVPDCDFLTAADLSRRILGVWRLLPRRPDEVRHSLPGAPRTAPGDGRFAGPAALLTALRYSCRGVLEAGGMALMGGLADAEAGQVTEALWEGLAEYMSSSGYGYALGRELVTPPEGLALEAVLRTLHDDHGLHPDLEAGSLSARCDWVRPAAGPEGGSGQAGRADRPGTAGGPGGSATSRSQARDWLPKGFREGLRRGIQLVGGPTLSAVAEGLEFSWIASGELLRRDGGAVSGEGRAAAIPGGLLRGAGFAA